MKRRHAFLGLALLSTSGAVHFLSAIPASAQAKPANVRFFCGKDAKGTPATMVKPLSAQRSSIPVVRWTSAYFSSAGFPPAKRCEVASKQFQDAYTKNPNFVFTTAILRGESVICAAPNRGGACETVLYTIKRGAQDPILTMMRLEKVRTGAAGPLNESSDGGVETSVGVQDLLNRLLEQKQSSASIVEQTSTIKALW
jgi:Circadian oscillating protein COP23